MCLTHHLWSDLSDWLRQFLEGISLADLASRKDIQSVHFRQDHHDGSDQPPDDRLARII